MIGSGHDPARAPGREAPARSRFPLSVLAAAGLVTLAWPGALAGAERVLARVELAGPLSSFNLPAHQLLRAQDGKDYLLVFASEAELNQAGWPWKPVATDALPEAWVVATEFRPGARQAARARFTPLLDDGRHWVLPATPVEAEALAELGFGLQRLTAEPMAPPRAHLMPDDPEPIPMPDSRVRDMLGTIQATNLYGLLRRLTGDETIVAGAEPRTITTRYTTSGLPLRKATEWAFERFQAVGRDPSYHDWTSGSYSSRNVVATQPGATRSNELVLITAHLDDMPSGTRAPGADDNASGSAAVLTTASIFAQYLWERSVRFVLFTGEEQGLLGSARYAAAAQAAGDNIVGVINLDMLAWDGTGPPTFQVHTRTALNSGYSNDLALAALFTNAVTAYGLQSNLAAVIKPDGLGASDHASFWNRGYAGICCIEDYGTDFNPYYHTTGDTLARVNWPYYTAAVRAAVATAAHLARPVARTGADAVEVVESNWAPDSRVGASVFVGRHLPEALETGADGWDVSVFSAPASTNLLVLQIASAPYGIDLATDSRPQGSQSNFLANLMLQAAESLSYTGGHQLRFDFPCPPAPDRVYLARLRLAAPFIGQAEDFLCVTNLRTLVSAGGRVALPQLQNVPGGAVYGVCEVAARFLVTNAFPLRSLSLAGTALSVATPVQVGTRSVDQFEWTAALAPASWVPLAVVTNDVPPEAATFDAGWVEITRVLDTSALPETATRFVRVKRTWLAP